MTSDRWEPAAFKARVDEVLHRFVAQEAGQLSAIDPQLGPVAAQLEAAVADGKRLRAAFCYSGWRAVGQPDSDALTRAAASMELVHAAAVVHDDLTDDSPLRHGRPTAHIALRGVVRRRPRAVAAARSLAMLVGDLLMSLAGQRASTCRRKARKRTTTPGAWSVPCSASTRTPSPSPLRRHASSSTCTWSGTWVRPTKVLTSPGNSSTSTRRSCPAPSSTRVSALIPHLVGDTCADWLQVPRTRWDTVVKAVPHLLGVLETIEDRSPLGAWALDRLGHLATVFELSSLTRGRVMHYAIPEQLKKDYGITGPLPRTHRWTPPAATVSG